MFKGAITIFALVIFLFSCTAHVATQPSSPLPVPPQPVLLPDLTISDLSLSEKGRVEVVISNIGKGPAPYGAGSLAIYVDGLLKWKDSLRTLPDQSFLEPGGTSRYTTPVELAGRHEVRAVLDKEEKTVEENKSSNVFPKVLGKEKSETSPLLSDLRITDIFLNPQRKLSVTIANTGNSPLPLKVGSLKIFVDGLPRGSYPLESFSDQPFLPPKGSVTFSTPVTLFPAAMKFLPVSRLLMRGSSPMKSVTT